MEHYIKVYNCPNHFAESLCIENIEGECMVIYGGNCCKCWDWLEKGEFKLTNKKCQELIKELTRITKDLKA